MKRSFFWLIKLLVLLTILIYLLSCKNEVFENEKFIIVDKGSYSEKYFLIAKIYQGVSYSDTLFTVITSQNYKYHENLWWDQIYYSKQITDTLELDYINKKRFWRKIE